ncbi:YceD family protein [Vagococcus xieshaowenii]|uniref:DUF177 domain-containing protein n=1 Tax=Vagococcus xieshaowenii TaxID=2562451 RepID=A0AAJ5EGE1_9ENTE|nr:YceD family protein [Vagococcus xieshaowenii]QCA28388.1 DUF177 domain-containing protein [Vagococcus xieshaowenii]TFZ42856.1 DUF177 domain-containing protein [Vagococcus xieshaowenii]
MKWSLMELRRYQHEPLVIDTTIELADTLLKRDETILGVGPVKVVGTINVEPREYIAQVQFDVVLTLPSSRSLEPVDYPMTIAFDEIYMIPEEYALVKGTEGYEHAIILESSTLDLREAIEDYILLNIPLKVLTEEEMLADELPSGDAWTIMSEEDYLYQQMETQAQTIDPRLAKLSALLDNNEESD